MNYQDYLSLKKTDGSFIPHNAGDTKTFRYPHLEHFQRYFSYNKQMEYWQFTPGKGTDTADAAGKIAREDITVYEFILPAARKLHFLDMAGVRYPEDDCEEAFRQVSELYQGKETGFPKAVFQTVYLKNLAIKKGFEYLQRLYQDLIDVPIHVLTLESVPQFPFGSVLKGTDLLVTDGSPMNFGQDILHILYHLKEGIPGQSSNNCFVQEIWAPVPALYALQLSEGRMSRRKRIVVSPHIIHFTDYIYLRAYLGQAFVQSDKEETIHPIYRIIEPSIQPIMYALRDQATFDRIRILADAVLEDKPEELISEFDKHFGKGSFSDVYGTYSIYEKYELMTHWIDPKKAEEIFFESPSLLPGSCSREQILSIWKDKEKRYENIALLSAGK